MKTILRLTLVTLCLSFGSCDIPGKLVGISRFASRAAASCENSVIPVCADCQTLRKCLNTDNPPPPTVNCKTAYPDRPYCSNGACTSEPSSDCVAPFTCTGAGYYPNPLNCSRYHLCGAAGAVGGAVATYECPTGFVYNPATTMCKLSTAATDCAVINCATDPYGYVAYPADSTFFASCTPNSEPLMLKCPIYNVYKPSTSECVFQCPREGRIAHPTDVKKYTDCYLNGSVYYYKEYTCIDGFQFNQAAQQCQLVTNG